jgi:hypothetical protein
MIDHKEHDALRNYGRKLACGAIHVQAELSRRQHRYQG